MDSNALRRAFTQYFVDQGHTAVASAGLIPHHSRAPLFTNAGMNQFIPFFLGEEIPPYPRATSIQKCVRIRGKHDDIELIGRTTRHLTFFEMLGNFSFGDYFKARAIPLAWNLLTDVFGLDGDRLWVTVYQDDDEAETIWRDSIGVPPGRIQRMDDDNFWEMGDTGPCGPCSEIYFDRGSEWGPDGGPAGGGEERFVELWNLVFMQFDRQADSSLLALPRPNIDTGAGLERILMVLQDVPAVWDTDVLRPIISEAERLTGRTYGSHPEVDVALRILADHARSMTFLIADGVFPSNEDRGYVLRRLIRRAVRQAYTLGVDSAVTPSLVETCTKVMGDAYPELGRSIDFVRDVAGREEARFRTTLRSGLAMLESELSSGAKIVSGEVAFKLHDTHGFPVELTREIVGERGATVDEAGFDAAMDRQKSLSNQARRSKAADGGDRTETYRSILDEHGPTKFVGYTQEATTSRILSVIDVPGEGQVEIFLDATPFYAEGGGQVGDTGTIETDTGRARVEDTTHALPGLTRHLAVVEDGELRPDQTASATIDSKRRAAIRRNHTGTHLIHWALRSVLGDHVKQQGSLVAPDRLRFDFTHYNPVSPEEIAHIEDLVNEQVLDDGEVVISVMHKHDADAAGAIAFFEDKYGDEVRVIQAGPVSLELCGGTHVSRLGQIGPVEIVSEGSIGSNLRRIEATTGTATLSRLRTAEQQLSEAAGLLRSRPDELSTAVERKLAEYRELETKLKASEQSALSGRVDELAANAVDGHLVARVDDLTQDRMRELAAMIRQNKGLDTVVLGGSPDGAKAALVAAVAKGGSPTAPELISDAARTVGGGGGGKNPEQAAAGGRDPSRLDEALEQVRRLLGE